MSVTAKPLRIPDSGKAKRLHVRVGACSVQGIRRDNNEDREYVSPTQDLFIVADGMGGHAAGEVASRFAVDAVSHDLARIKTDASDDEVEQRVKFALDRAHCMIVDTGNADSTRKVVAGSTVLLALLRNHRLFVAGVGDSRAYLLRNGELQRLTVDDTWPEMLVRMGKISVDQARNHHMRHCLMSALGIHDYDSEQEEIHIIDVYAGDRFLLASDGLTDNATDQQIAKIMGAFDNPQEAAEELAFVARAEGGGDDTTCIVFYVGNSSTDADMERHAAASQRSTWWQFLTSAVPGALR